MPETANGKIQTLLDEAARQADAQAAETSSVAAAARRFPSELEAEKAFSRLYKKLFRIEEWNGESGFSSFELFDKNGNSLPARVAGDGDFIKITMPGSGKSDWVRIVEIHITGNEVILTVQPSRDPTEKEAQEEETEETAKKNVKKITSHFFTGDSTNNFCLQIKNAQIFFYVIGLNERTNTGETGGVLETVRNLATANIGSFLGIQKAQWQTFCENFLTIEE